MFRKKKDDKDEERRGKPGGPFDDMFSDFGGFGRIDEIMNEMMRNMFRGINLNDVSNVEREPGKPYVYGFSMRTGPDGKPIVNEFGNVKAHGKPHVTDAREPLVDVIEKEAEVIVVAELPGVNKEDIDLEALEGSLEIRVDSKGKKYYKEVSLPSGVVEGKTEATYKNGILEVKLKKKVKKKPKGKRIEIR